MVRSSGELFNLEDDPEVIEFEVAHDHGLEPEVLEWDIHHV